MNFRNLLAIGVVSVLIAAGIIFIKPKSSSINLVGGSTLPLTGTFIVPDLFYSSASDYDRLLEEMQDAGINLVILSLTGQLRKNCTTGQFSEDKSSDRLNTHLINLINSATKYQMEIFFEVGNIEKSSCFPYYQGKAKVFLANSETEEAVDLLKKALKVEPNNAGVLFDIGTAFQASASPATGSARPPLVHSCGGTCAELLGWCAAGRGARRSARVLLQGAGRAADARGVAVLARELRRLRKQAR